MKEKKQFMDFGVFLTNNLEGKTTHQKTGNKHADCREERSGAKHCNRAVGGLEIELKAEKQSFVPNAKSQFHSSLLIEQ